MSFRRFVNASLALALLFAAVPAPARAMSTAAEIEQAKEQEKQIISQYNILADPLLNGWVNDIGNRLWGQVARRDLPYNAKIIDAADINSFTIGGGYIYVNEGLLDFVQSDDELAGVIGHETGHDERRHTVTLPAKAQALNLLFGIAAIFSPIVYRFGQLAEAGIIAKQSRADELQADQYGLQLMSRAGYDPESMLTFMQHLGAAEADHSSLVDKYLQDHPGFPDRVKHLLGYEELDPTKRTNDQLLVQALRDQEDARYSFAAQKFQRVLLKDPTNATALLHLGEAQIALGEPEKSRQTLAQAAERGTAETRSTALYNIASLRQSDSTSFRLGKPNLAPLRQQLADAQTRETAADATIQVRRDAAKDQLKSVDNRVQNISYGIPNFGNIPVRSGSRLDAVLKNFAAMARSIDAAFSKSSTVTNGVGSLEVNKESGVIKENASILHDMNAPLALDVIPTQSLALLPQYPRILDDMALTDGDLVRALDAARSSLAILDVSLGDLNDFAQRLNHSQFDYRGDLSESDYRDILPYEQKATDGLNRAAIAASQAQQLYNLARSRQLQSSITLLGIGFPQNRYATLRYALDRRVKNTGVDYETLNRDDLSAGEVATASIVAADTKTTPEAVIDEAKTTHRQIVDVANARGMSAQALEIFLGLVYLDYTDDPEKEAHGH